MNTSFDKKGTWGRWLIVVVLLMVKCYVFDVLIAQPESIGWVLSDFLSTGAAAALLALPVVLTSRRYPAFIILGLADGWMIANILYYRSYRLFITWHLVSVATNINGFGNSLLPYCTWSLLLFPLLTLPAFLCFAWSSKRLGITGITAVWLISLFLSIAGSRYRWKNFAKEQEPFNWEWINPCTLPQSLSAHISEHERQAGKYIRYHSILSYPLFMAYDAAQSPAWRQRVQLTEEEQAELNKLINPVEPATPIQGNLLLIVLESFESWPMEVSDTNGDPVCLALNRYIATHDNCLYVKDVATQIRYGMSGDGHLIINTGLYPVSEGVTCVDYASNTYPNLAHFYPHSAIVNPCRNVWNKTVIAPAYGYRQLIEPDSDNPFAWNDSIVTDQTIAAFYALDTPVCVMTLSISCHIPFTSAQDDIPIADTVPELFRNYLRSIHYTDRQIGRLLAWADTAAVMRNSMIAITGDHRIFHAWLNDEVREYGLRANLPFGTSQAGCPFILTGPGIPKRTVESGAQVDVFSTILPAIGQANYYWKGMGHNLLEEETGSPEESNLRFTLSDKLIRMNYFRGLVGCAP